MTAAKCPKADRHAGPGARPAAGAHDRILEVATDLFTDRGFEQVSIGAIATAAHCSTATIYDMFETKEKLFEAALALGRREWPTPFVELPETDANAFEALLTYCGRRIEYLGSPRLRGLILGTLRRLDRGGEGVEMAALNQHGPLTRVVEAAIRAGHLTRVPASETAYCLLSGASFEPLMSNLHKIGSASVTELALRIVTPFMTETGRTRFDAWQAGFQPRLPQRSGEALRYTA